MPGSMTKRFVTKGWLGPSMPVVQGCGSGSAWIRIHFPPGSGSAFNMQIRIRIQEGKFVN